MSQRLPPAVRSVVNRIGDESYFLGVCLRRGVLAPQPPVRLLRMGAGVLRHGTFGGAIHAVALRFADRVAMVDERGPVTYAELDDRSNAIANGWLARGLESSDGVAILARNHRHFLEAFFAAAKCGARVILLNTEFSGPQLRDVLEREGTDLLVHDDEYAALLERIEPRHGRWRAWADHPGPDTLDHLASHESGALPPRPREEARLTLLTSGTTGTPKGANRSVPKTSLAPVGALLGRVPLRSGQTMELCAPMFHSLGLATMMFGIALGSTLVVRRRFDPAGTWRSISEHRAESLVLVPVMLQRMLDLDPAQRDGLSHDSLSVVLSGGSQLGSQLCTRALSELGPVVHNFYGSTEMAYATVATPEELGRKPATVGRVLRGTVVKVVDADGIELPAGETGRILVGNSVQFEGYTGGGTKEYVDGLMASGDVGHFDAEGLLFIDGRDDEMIVSGGENVFPREVEELYEQHPAVREAAVVGVADEEYGQRLRAFLALRPGASMDETEAKDHVRENLARYKVPREVVFLDELPRNPTGKVLRRALLEG